MTPDREKNMRSNLAEMGNDEIITTCVQMQVVIDGHVTEKTGLTGSIAQMQRQIPALKTRILELEAAADGTTIVGTVEFEALQDENGRLRKRIETLQELNEGLQAKLIA